MEPVKVRLRWMVNRDMPAVFAIEKTCNDPWSGEDFANFIKGGYRGLVAESGNQIVGYMVYGVFNDRFSISNLVVHPRWVGRTVGRQMVEQLIRNLSSTGRRRITALSGEVDLHVHLFLRAMGFNAIQILRGHFDHAPDEDAYLFEYLHADFPLLRQHESARCEGI